MTTLIDAVERLGRWLSFLAASAACTIMVVMTALIVAEVTMRTIFSRSTYIVEEYTSYGVGAMVFLGLAYCLEQGQLIRVNLVVGALDARARHIVEFLICMVTLAVMAFLIYFFWLGAARHAALGTISMTTARTPLWIPEAILVVGMIVFWIRVAIYAVHLASGRHLIADNIEVNN
jgi:TRAP-type C4-dicarboxylate transport system permease small subunit